MDSIKIMVSIVFALGFIGCVSMIPIAAFPRSTLRSKSIFIRIISKSLMFSFCLFVSFLIMAMPLAWIISIFEIKDISADSMLLIYLISCIPLAIIIYRIDIAIMGVIYRFRDK